MARTPLMARVREAGSKYGPGTPRYMQEPIEWTGASIRGTRPTLVQIVFFELDEPDADGVVYHVLSVAAVSPGPRSP